MLPPLSEKLLWAERMRVERLSPQLLSIEGADEIGRLITPARRSMQIHASPGHAIAALVQTLADAEMPVDIRYRDSVDAIASLLRGEGDLAGLHLPDGRFDRCGRRSIAHGSTTAKIYWCI
ncbi:hypothetical protein [Mycetohabitans rhizoxinica]|uniref:Transcriptional regulators, LysR family n=1 Tax=Mycetohabitans rhizoxinica TaxID=412963 RepID=A0ABZ2PY57_9BURK